jgi:aldehyde dehydrogenase (NAD(P)+)
VIVVDSALETLAAAKDAWVRLPLERRIALLDAVRRRVFQTAPEWAEAASRAKGLPERSPLAGEEWISGPWAVLYALNRYLRTLRGIAAQGEAPLPRMRSQDGRVVLDVFPHDLYDRLLLSGIRAEVWMKPGFSREQILAADAPLYREPGNAGRVALVLGAGNISSIAPLDVLYKLIFDGAVCLLKLNPVNEYLGPILERALAPLIDAGYVRFAYGGGDVGAYLCAHELVDEVHVTGSERTHQAIVAESGGAKRITSELGNVSPAIVIPGTWNRSDVRFQAENIATQKAHNAGFNCIATQVLVLPRDWEHSGELLAQIGEVLQQSEPRPEYYPGARERRERLSRNSPNPFSIMRVDPDDAAHPAFTSEAFCGFLAYVELPGRLEEYVPRAIAFANERLHGTLGASVIVHPATMREHQALLTQAVRDLHYGCVGVNAWTGVGYFIAETPWGAYPGHTLEEPGSGIGVVHNAYLLTGTEKSVVHAPFAPFPRSFAAREYSLLPKPPWFITNRMQAEIGHALCDFEIEKTPQRAAAVAALAMRA